MKIIDTNLAASSHTIRNILDEAENGTGIDYWAKIRNVVKRSGRIESFEVGDNAPDGEPVKKGWRVVNARVIMKARDLIVNGEIDLNRGTRAQFIGPPHDWEYDVDGIDALIQVIFFGEIVYG